jgi:hypothetical protein
MVHKYQEVLGDHRLAEFDVEANDQIRGTGQDALHKRSEIYREKGTQKIRLSRHIFRRINQPEPTWNVSYLVDDTGQEYTAVR